VVRFLRLFRVAPFAAQEEQHGVERGFEVLAAAGGHQDRDPALDGGDDRGGGAGRVEGRRDLA
jgi:hypothetical protein